MTLAGVHGCTVNPKGGSKLRSVRRSLGLVLAAVAAMLTGAVFGEYEFRDATVALGSGPAVGWFVSTALVTSAGWRGKVPSFAAAVLSVAGVLLAGWIDADRGVEPYPWQALFSAAVAGGAAAFLARTRQRVTNDQSPTRFGWSESADDVG